MKTIYLICRSFICLIAFLLPLVLGASIMMNPHYPGKGIEAYLIGVGSTLIGVLISYGLWFDTDPSNQPVESTRLRGIWR